jgi:misshapen/NIK-related kinase
MFDLSKVPNPKGHVELLEIIGKGNFGYVYKVCCGLYIGINIQTAQQQGRMTATKEIAAVKVVQLKEEEMREILLEVEILQDCSHSNITRFMGKFVRNEDLWVRNRRLNTYSNDHNNVFYRYVWNFVVAVLQILCIDI